MSRKERGDERAYLMGRCVALRAADYYCVIVICAFGRSWERGGTGTCMGDGRSVEERKQVS